RFTLLAPSTPRMMIGAHVGGIAKEDLGFFALRQGLDPRVFLLEPLSYQGLVAFLRAVQGLLAGDAELRQQPTNRIGTQHDTKLVLDQLCHHIARPQRERELQLQRILPRYGVVNPLHGARIQFGRSAEKRLGLQRSPSTSPILGQPSVYRTADDPQGSRDNFGAFAGLYAPHGADAHRFQRRVIQLAGIILSHSTSESDQIRNVKKKVEITYGLTNRPSLSASVVWRCLGWQTVLGSTDPFAGPRYPGKSMLRRHLRVRAIPSLQADWVDRRDPHAVP